ncbi:MAG TPA: hypothetical protein VGW11_12130 [Solirubrobacteraceae bacterium]|nr:hypothetical protein [Solirubrobacteraceae bacterium]
MSHVKQLEEVGRPRVANLTFPVAGLLIAVPLAIVMFRRLRALPRID